MKTMDKADKIFKCMALYVKTKDQKLSQCSKQEVDKPIVSLEFLDLFLWAKFSQPTLCIANNPTSLKSTGLKYQGKISVQ